MDVIKLLIVDDDVNFVEELCKNLSRGFQVQKAYTFQEALEIFSSSLFDVVLLDIRLEENFSNKQGLELLKIIKSQQPELPVLIMTAYSDVDIAVESLKLGAEDFIQKNKVGIEEYRVIINNLFKTGKLKKKISGLESKLKKLEPWEIVGNSPAIESVRKQIKLVAEDGQINVLIVGETGTGKELVAKAIHREGIRKEEPFVIVSLSALNKETIASDLFGHEKGAFTGAENRRIGFIEEANKGIIFLDEIGELDQEIQVKLLRVIETKEFTRLGSNKQIRVDVQWLMATHQNLEKLVREGKFREDLYYRLKSYQIFLPPLRERKEDIPLLVDHFLSLFREQHRTTIEKIDSRAIETLMNYHWPGNIRELKQAIEYAILRAKFSNENTVKVEHLPVEIIRKQDNVSQREEKDVPVDIGKKLAEIELSYIAEALEKTKRKTDAYLLLGYKNRFTLRRRVLSIFCKYPELKSAFPIISKFFEKKI